MALRTNMCDESTRMLFSIYKPLTDRNIDAVVAHISKLVGAMAKGALLLKSINDSWVAVLSIWNSDDCAQNVEESELCKNTTSSVTRVVEWKWVELSCEEHTEDMSLAKVKVGDIVNVRRIYSSRKKQEVLAYSCLALLKSFFKHTKGNRSYSYFTSTDGKRIVGLGVWDSLESASAVLKSPSGSPGEAYWYGLGAKMLKYEICTVVSVTGLWDCNAPISNDRASVSRVLKPCHKRVTEDRNYGEQEVWG